MNIDTLKTFCQGALGAMTFGAYHQYTTNKMIDLNNETQNLKQQTFMDSMKLQHIQEMDNYKNEINDLKNKLSNLEKKNQWW